VHSNVQTGLQVGKDLSEVAEPAIKLGFKWQKAIVRAGFSLAERAANTLADGIEERFDLQNLNTMSVDRYESGDRNGGNADRHDGNSRTTDNQGEGNQGNASQSNATSINPGGGSSSSSAASGSSSSSPAPGVITRSAAISHRASSPRTATGASSPQTPPAERSSVAQGAQMVHNFFRSATAVLETTRGVAEKGLDVAEAVSVTGARATDGFLGMFVERSGRKEVNIGILRMKRACLWRGRGVRRLFIGIL
jgi:hypothetical protein